MQKLIKFAKWSLFLPLIIMLSVNVQAASNDQLPPKDSYFQQTLVQTFLLKAMAYITAHGKEKALEAFNSPTGGFYFPEKSMYIFAFSTEQKSEGQLLANIDEPGSVGENHYNEKDVKGNYLVRDIINKAKQGGGWVHYYWVDLSNKKIQEKWTYVVPVSKDWLIGAGFYPAIDYKD